VQELNARKLAYPVLIGGAAINPSFGRMASFVDAEKGELYGPGVWYCKDAFEGLSAVDALVDPERRANFVRTRHAEVIEGTAKRAALVERTKASARVRTNGGPARAIDIPAAPFYGVKTLHRLPLEHLFRYIDLNTLYRLHWGAKNAKGEHWQQLVKEEFEPRLERYRREAQAGGWLRPKAVYGYFPAGADGEDIVIYDPKDPTREVERFSCPRQSDREHLSLADYFTPVAEGRRDVVALQVVTVGDALLEKSERLMQEGDYSEGYYMHGFGVRFAEAGAEYVHGLIRNELGLGAGRGLRYSWGYPAIPDHTQHATVFRLLPAREDLGMDVTEAGALVPELSTAAVVVHHPEAKYFSV
jgi:5-methyltetrahydrofolate--homocysteine methyltransferase